MIHDGKELVIATILTHYTFLNPKQRRVVTKEKYPFPGYIPNPVKPLFPTQGDHAN